MRAFLAGLLLSSHAVRTIVWRAILIVVVPLVAMVALGGLAGIAAILVLVGWWTYRWWRGPSPELERQARVRDVRS